MFIYFLALNKNTKQGAINMNEEKNWKKAEIEKFKNKKIRYQQKTCQVSEVFWLENEEKFVFYLEDETNQLYKAYENEFELFEKEVGSIIKISDNIQMEVVAKHWDQELEEHIYLVKHEKKKDKKMNYVALKEEELYKHGGFIIVKL